MAVTPAYEHAIPLSVADAFEHGEHAVSPVTPIGSATGNTTYYLSKWFDLEGGNYVVSFFSDDAASLWTGSSQDTLRMFKAHTATQGVVQFAMFFPPGLQRIDILLQHLGASASECYFVLTLSKTTVPEYVSDASGWVFDSTAIDDEDVPQDVDPRRRLPVFSMLPNWQDGIVERLSFMSDVMSSEYAVEQRRSLREYARRSFDVSFMRNLERRAQLDMFLTGIGRGDLMMPLWHEQYRPTVALTTGTTSITFPAGELELREFRPGDLVFINNGDPNDYDVVEVDTVETTSITLVDSPTKTWPLGTRIIPMRQAWISEDPQMDNRSDRVGSVTVRFDLHEAEDVFEPNWGYCAPLFQFKPDWQETVNNSYSRSFFELDNQVGKVQVTDPGGRSIFGQRFGLKLFGRASVVKLRQFLNIASGRAVRFYIPTFTNDVIPIEDIFGYEFDARVMGFAKYLSRPQVSRLILSFVFADGRPTIYRDIESIEPIYADDDPDLQVAERFTLTQEAPPIQLAELERVTFIVPSRFDQDAFELKHHVDSSAAVSTSIVTVSTGRDDMPPIECFVTSKPYPIDPLDELDLGAVPIGGTMFTWPIESMDTSGSVQAGVLRDNRYPYNHPAPESLDVLAASIVSSDLRVGIIAYNHFGYEALNILDAAVQSGTLQVLLITYANWPYEGFDLSASIVGGTLT